ncbi:MAG: adenosylcobinamide-GDP ribazoletransferase [Cellulosilyticum sp.]|nr:adenosylcobinamide-GDP ribazoletransferase [Cellulosilyticum sp.]
MKRFLGVLQFMTRIPVPVDTGFDKEFHKGMIYFPLVGLVLGVCYYVVALLGLRFFNEYITTILILGAEVILTGGLHLDGLGDTFDGLYSYRDKDRILEIMKDSRLGTNGLLAILLILMLKVGFIYEVVNQYVLWILIVMPAVARTMQVVACYKTTTPRENGMGNTFIGKVSTKRLMGTYAMLLLVMVMMGFIVRMWFVEWFGVVAIVSGTVAVLTLWTKLFVRSVYKKIDGITGDILGAICELAELLFLIVLYLISYL